MKLIGEMPEQYVDDNTIIDQILKRVPFFKEYNIHRKDDNFGNSSIENKLEAQKINFYENVAVSDGKGGSITFPQYNVISNFIYFLSYMGGDRKRYIFNLKNEFKLSPPKEMDDLTYRIIILAEKQKSEQLSYSEDVIVDLNDEDGLTKQKFNEIINNINGKIFKWEEVTENLKLPQFN
jgi:hypothetical protein